jgi:hypothetical protein
MIVRWNQTYYAGGSETSGRMLNHEQMHKVVDLWVMLEGVGIQAGQERMTIPYRRSHTGM